MPHIELVTLIVRDYDPAIAFFVDVLGFTLAEDSPATTNDGRPKRWVVVRPPGAETGLLLARADGEQQAKYIGTQFAGRVGLFLRVDDFDAMYDRLEAAGVVFVSPPRVEPYGRVAVFTDLEGNRWDLLGPAHTQPVDPRSAPEPGGPNSGTIILALGAVEVAIIYLLLVVDSPVANWARRMSESWPGRLALAAVGITVICAGMFVLLTILERRRARQSSVSGRTAAPR